MSKNYTEDGKEYELRSAKNEGSCTGCDLRAGCRGNYPCTMETIFKDVTPNELLEACKLSLNMFYGIGCDDTAEIVQVLIKAIKNATK
jgi:hypothetical protein